MGFGGGWRPYVSVAARRQQAAQKMSKLKKQGLDIQPVEIAGRKIARTFWGESWCKHLESFSDYENRLPRGRTYVRNGSVCHLQIARGEVKAIVSGSALYDVKIMIKELPNTKWGSVKERCSGQIGSLLELLQGRLSNSVMAVVTDRKDGLFPLPAEIDLDCSCPDWAVMCKHVAAVLYGVGARLDEQPELLFLLRAVDHEELIAADAAAVTSLTSGKQGKQRRIAAGDLEDIFGIEIVEEESPDNGRQQGKQDSIGMDMTNQPGKAKITARKATTDTKENEKEKSSQERASTRTSSHSPSTSSNPPLTGKTVRELRSRLDLTQSRFALLIGVSAASINNWEKTRGPLNLQPRTMSALNEAMQLTKKQALRRLDKA
jgi:uncharacterized Zn finger protein